MFHELTSINCQMCARKLTILYGSQTGNAQDVADRIWRESKRFYFTGCVKSMDDYNVKELINEKYVIFVCSTTGQGDEPDNMRLFWKFLLKRNLPPNLLLNLKCAVLGLGDSSYSKFNFVAKRLYKRLAQLGAELILPLALGDDQHDLGYDAVVDVWIESLWKELLILYPLKNKEPLDNILTIKPRWKISVLGVQPLNNNNSHMYYNDTLKLPDDQMLVELKDNIRTTSKTHFQDVRLLIFTGNNLSYSPGDVLNVRPRNSQDQIRDFYEVLNANGIIIDPETIYKVSECDPDMPVPEYLKSDLKFKTLCEEYFDLSSIPRRYVFNILAQLTTSELEREKCIEFTTAEGQNELYNYCNRPRRNIIEVLRDFPHAVENMTIEMLFEVLPPIKSRSFSIASSVQAHGNEIHLLVAIVKYKTKLYKERLGLCSNWLSNLNVGDKIPIWIRKGTFWFPSKENIPIIMVGPGTGVAPFRSFISELSKLNKATAENNVLFFGCRREKDDFHCENDFKKYVAEKKLSLICAFSRDQDNKIYVQHKIKENQEKIWDLLNKGAYIFVAGSSKNMPQAVQESFQEIIMKYGQMNRSEAEIFISNLEKNKHYQTETWS